MIEYASESDYRIVEAIKRMLPILSNHGLAVLVQTVTERQDKLQETAWRKRNAIERKEQQRIQEYAILRDKEEGSTMKALAEKYGISTQSARGAARRAYYRLPNALRWSKTIEEYEFYAKLFKLVYKGRTCPSWEDVSSKNNVDILNQSVDVLELSIRSANVLCNHSVDTIGDLIKLSRFDLLKKKNCGRKSLKEIEELLAVHDLTLRQEEGP